MTIITIHAAHLFGMIINPYINRVIRSTTLILQKLRVGICQWKMIIK